MPWVLCSCFLVFRDCHWLAWSGCCMEFREVALFKSKLLICLLCVTAMSFCYWPAGLLLFMKWDLFVGMSDLVCSKQLPARAMPSWQLIALEQTQRTTTLLTRVTRRIARPRMVAASGENGSLLVRREVRVAYAGPQHEEAVLC